jgi:outer membrane receptor protein involved in Fe transport
LAYTFVKLRREALTAREQPRWGTSGPLPKTNENRQQNASQRERKKEGEFLNIQELFRKFRGHALIAILLFACFAPSSLHAQVGVADVLGTVTDPSGAVIPNAKVTITNLGTAVARTATTNDKGEYLINTLPNGSYKLTVESQGFKSATIPSLLLSTGDRARFDVKLQTGVVSESVEVTGVTGALQTDSSTVTSTLEPTAVQDMPVANRNFFALVETMPGLNTGQQGTSSKDVSWTSGASPVDRRPFSTVSANGQNAAVNNNMVNGFDNNGITFGNPAVRPNVDGISEMKVLSTNAPAEFGRAQGAVVNVVTKSGTNTLHGSAFEYLRNEATDSRDFFDRVTLDPHKGLYRQNNYGGSLGGPIKKDKTFFFFAIEKDWINRGATSTSFVPTQYEHDHPGDFSDVNGVTLTTDQMSTLMLNMFKLYAAPNAGESGGIGYYTAAPTGQQRITDLEGRVDQNFSNRNILYARYAWNPAHTFDPSTMPDVNGVSPVSGTADTSDTNSQNLQIDYVHIINSNLVLDLRTGYTRYNTLATGETNGKGLAAKFGEPNPAPTGTVSDTIPFVGGPSFAWTGIGGPHLLPYADIDNVFQYSGALTYTHGSHQFKFGGGLIQRQIRIMNETQPGAFALFGVPLPPYFDQRADFVAGYPVFINRATPIFPNRLRTSEWSVYGQDDWRVNPRLTLNLGVRYDIFGKLRDAKDLISNFNAATLSDGLPLDAHNFFIGGTAGAKTDLGSIAPRVGFAYSLTPNTVIRGGVGLTYSPVVSPNDIATNGNPPFNFNYFFFFPDLKTTAPWILPAEPDMSTWNSNSSVTTVAAPPTNVPDLRTYQSNLAVQRQFGVNTITLAYVGVYGRREPNNIDLNEPKMPGAGNPTPTYIYTSNKSNTSGNPDGVLTNVTSITSQTYNATSNYNAMQLIYERRFVSGLTLNSNYTWAHGLASGIGASNGSLPVGDSANGDLSYGNSANDLRHRMTVQTSYPVPFGKSYTGLKAAVAKGWQLNTVFQWQTGSAYSAQASASCIVALDSRCSVGPNNSYTNQPSGFTTKHYLPNIIGKPIVNGMPNPDAFGPQVPGTQGDEGINPFHGPHFRSDDFSIFKKFKMTERFSMQFRAECFNISNTPNFQLTSDNTTIATWIPGTVTQENPSGLVAQPNGKFGEVTSTSAYANPRQFQFALKLLF